MLRKIRKMLQQQEGFTLVELMIVVVILGILAGIGIQQYGNVQARAKQAAHEANVKVLTSAANMYLMMTNIAEDDWEGNVITITALEENVTSNELVPQYLDDWPDNPTGVAYEVKITRTPGTGENVGNVFYSIAVTPE
jgi:type IV pilus assembly protein PilA